MRDLPLKKTSAILRPDKQKIDLIAKPHHLSAESEGCGTSAPTDEYHPAQDNRDRVAIYTLYAGIGFLLPAIALIKHALLI